MKAPRVVALCSIGHTAALGALAGVMRARALRCRRARRLRGLRGPRCHSRARVPVPRLGVRGARTPAARGQRGRHLAPHRGLPVRRRLRVDDVDTAAARRDALGARRRHPPRGVRPSRRVRANPETKEILDSVLYPWLFEHTRAEGTAAAQAAGWPFAGVYSPAEVLEADHLHQRGFWTECDDPTIGPVLLPGPPYRHAEGGWQHHRPAPAAVRAANGNGAAAVPRRARPATAPTVRPIPRRHRCRGSGSSTSPRCGPVPYVTQLLADLGAEVIRVENPSVFPPTTKGYLPRPSPTMLLGSLLSMYAPPADGEVDRPYNRHAMNNSIARNKLSCTLDPRRPDGRELLMRLVEQSDVFVENLKTSTLHQIGIHETELLDRNPRMLVLRIPAGRPHRRLGRLHRLRRAVRRPQRVRPARRPPRPRDGRDAAHDVHGRRDRAGGRVRRAGRAALPRRGRARAARRARPDRERAQPARRRVRRGAARGRAEAHREPGSRTGATGRLPVPGRGALAGDQRRATTTSGPPSPAGSAGRIS